MQKRSSKRKETNETAFGIVQQIEAASEGRPDAVDQIVGDADLRKQVMREMGRQGGLKGGKARAANLTPEERTRIASEAARKRWSKG